MKMYYLRFFVIFILSNITIVFSQEYDEQNDQNTSITREDRKPRYQPRPLFTNKAWEKCVRRFSPGVCFDPVKTVWSYVPQLQTCVMRLGCTHRDRTNRFSSFHSCAYICRPLSQVYADLIAKYENNSFDDGRLGLRSRHWTSFRRRAFEQIDLESNDAEDHYMEDKAEDQDTYWSLLEENLPGEELELNRKKQMELDEDIAGKVPVDIDVDLH